MSCLATNIGTESSLTNNSSYSIPDFTTFSAGDYYHFNFYPSGIRITNWTHGDLDYSNVLYYQELSSAICRFRITLVGYYYK